MRAFGCILAVSSAYANPQEHFSEHTMDLYQDFMSHFQFYQMNPQQTMINKTLLAENPLYTRSKAVDLLYKYTESATRDLYADKYLEDPDYHHVHCICTFTWSNYNPVMTQSGERELTLMEQAVRRGLDGWTTGGLFTHNFTSKFVKMVPITEEIQMGLKIWGPGQRGVVAKENISAWTAIGIYYGDEYLSGEFDTQFSWGTYGHLKDHPFTKKWDYSMFLDYSTWADPRFNLPPGVMVNIDSYHEYDHLEYALEGGLTLTPEELWTKNQMIPNYINDARASLYQPYLYEEDMMRKNSEFVYCSVDGIMLPFVVVYKDVDAEQQLFIYYGPNYGLR